MQEKQSESSGAIASAIVLASVFVVAICGLVYELIAGTLASYLLGDSTRQFSLTIGLFLTSMGAGSFISRYITSRLAFWFVLIEVLVGVVGGFSGLLGFAAFAYTDYYQVILALLVFIIGALVGLEIPLVIRLLKEVRSLRVTVANVFTVDYAGAFAASLLFPFVLLPHLGLVRAALVVGISNVLVGAVLLAGLRKQLGSMRRPLLAGVILSLVLLSTTAFFAERLVSTFENRVYQDEVIYSETSRFQNIVLTRWRSDLRLYLNGHLQFSSVDEYRYHESLAIPPLEAALGREHVLILGGGDGLLARQVLKYQDVTRITVVDLDPAVTGLFSENAMLLDLNDRSLLDDRVEVVNADAMEYLAASGGLFDVILIDLPDPSEAALAKLYSQAFYRLCLSRLADGGVVATQATSPFKSREAFWCIERTMAAASKELPGSAERLKTAPYHVYIPTFGTWGFVMASRRRIDPATLNVSVSTRFLNQSALTALFTFPKDMGRTDGPINRLNEPVLTDLYRDGYHKYLD